MIELKEIKYRISEAIQSSGRTQTAIAKELGIRQQQVSCYIKGEKLPALDTLANLCVLLDLDANDILCIHEHKACDEDNDEDL